MVRYHPKPDNVGIPPSIYFGGCCFGAAFYVGVYKAMVDKWGADFVEHTHFSGGSAGTVFALGLALGKDVDYMDNLYRKLSAYVVQRANVVTPVYHASVIMEELVRDMLYEDPESYKKLHGRLCLSTTSFFANHHWHSSWASLDELMHHVLASVHIPFTCPRGPLIRGVEVVDGAYSFAGVDLPDGDDSLYVGIDPHAEITTSLTTAQMFFPAIGKDYDDLVQLGYDNFNRWDGTMIHKVGNRRPNWEALFVLWTLKFLEVPFHLAKDIVYSLVHLFVALLKAVGILRVSSVTYRHH